MRTKITTDKKMKTMIKLTLAVILTAGTFHASAQDDALARLRAQRAQALQQLGSQPADTAPVEAPAATPDANAAPATPPAILDSQPPMQTPAAMPEQNQFMNSSANYASTPLSTNGITFNFRNAPLDQVLTYMSDAAGFTIILNTPVRGNVSIISSHPMTKDKAVDVLNSILNQNNLAAIRDGDTLTIMSKSDALHSTIPVIIGSDFTKILNNDEIVTQIIPIRFVDAQQLLVDISPFRSEQAVVIANQAGNSIIITDTQANIRHLTQIISAIDSSAQMETEVHVFSLKNANPNDVVAMLQAVFPSTGGGQTISVGGRGGAGGRGGRGGGFGGGGNPFAALFGGGNSGNSSDARVQKAQEVLAVADGRTQSVIVTAAKDLIPQIQDMIAEVDVPSPRDQTVTTIHLDNGDPNQVAQELQNMFGGTTARNSSTVASLLNTRGQSTLSTSTSGTGTTGTTGGSRNGGGY